eukprot:112350-Chlamydomonas_euryale.AAC.3
MEPRGARGDRRGAFAAAACAGFRGGPACERSDSPGEFAAASAAKQRIDIAVRCWRLCRVAADIAGSAADAAAAGAL